MFVVNGFIAVKPFEQTGIKVQVKSGFATAAQKMGLIPTVVVYGNAVLLQNKDAFWVEPGDTVWVKGDVTKHAQMKEVFDVGDGPFVLLQTNLVVLVDQKPKKGEAQ